MYFFHSYKNTRIQYASISSSDKQWFAKFICIGYTEKLNNITNFSNKHLSKESWQNMALVDKWKKKTKFWSCLPKQELNFFCIPLQSRKESQWMTESTTASRIDLSWQHDMLLTFTFEAVSYYIMLQFFELNYPIIGNCHIIYWLIVETKLLPCTKFR